MAEFTADFHSLMMDPRLFDYPMSIQSNFCLSDDMFCASPTPENPRNPDEIFPKSNQILQQILSAENESHETRKRRAIDEPQTSSAIKTPQASENGIKRKKLLKTGRGRKREKKDEREEEKPGEIVLVRARRGQATDSHSLAERVRRGKINERLRCLQDIVPGCYKSMGMAVMLDEIINYVQSLQNQVEFLSMKLASASSFNYWNSQKIAPQDDPRWSEEFEPKALERSTREECGTLACFQSSWPF